MGFKPNQRCIPQLGGEFRALHSVLVYFHVPRFRLVNELGASVRFVGNHATQVARVPCVQPLETWVQRVTIMWFRNSDGVSIHRRWFVLNWPRGLWLFSSRGCISSRSFARGAKTRCDVKNKLVIDFRISPRKKYTYHFHEVERLRCHFCYLVISLLQRSTFYYNTIGFCLGIKIVTSFLSCKLSLHEEVRPCLTKYWKYITVNPNHTVCLSEFSYISSV